MTKSQQIKILVKALKYYRKGGTKKVLNNDLGERGYMIENGIIADEALFKAGVSKKRLVKISGTRDSQIAKKQAKVKSSSSSMNAFTQVHFYSPDLTAVVGASSGTRIDAIKKLCNYIQKNKLQEKNNRRIIVADEKLLPLFRGIKKVSMFDLTKILSANMKTIEGKRVGSFPRL